MGNQEMDQHLSARGAQTVEKSFLSLDSILAPKSSLGPAVNTILGLEGRNRGTLQCPNKVDGKLLSAEERRMVSEIYKQAQIGNENFGKDLEKILPVLLKKDAELLHKLYKVATSDELFTHKVSRERRAEFLVEILTAASSPTMLNQGHSLMCTVTKQFSASPVDNIIRVSCDLATEGRATLASGRSAILGNGSEGLEKLIEWAEKASGHKLNGQGQGSIALNQLAARQTGPCMTMVLGTLMELNVSDVTQRVGQTWSQFSRSWRSQMGFETVCAAFDAKIPVDESGKPVWCHDSQGKVDLQAGTKAVSATEYIDLTLARKASEVEPSPRGIMVNMRWADPRPRSGNVSEHVCHTLMVVGKENQSDGVWYKIENPVGSYMKVGPDGKPHRFAPGTVLGDKSATWWKEGEDGIVYVREDVFKDSLIHLMVDHVDIKVTERDGELSHIHTLGSVNGIAGGRYEGVLETHAVELQKSADEPVRARDEFAEARAKEMAQDEEAWRKGIAQNQFDKALQVREKGAQESPIGVGRYKPREEDVLKQVDENLDLQESETTKKKNGKDFLFGNRITERLEEKLEKMSQAVNPPPPPGSRAA
jgi:hypothetical protein